MPAGAGRMTPADTMQSVIYSGLTYAEIPGFRPLLLDLHVPDDAADVPVVVWIHGGGYISGDRRYLPPTLVPGSIFAALTGAGLACASVDYRLAAEAGWPAQREDIAAAIGFLRSAAGECGLDATRLGTWGESAGGHLALMAGLTEPGIAGVVAWYPLTDLALLPPSAFSGSEQTRLLGRRAAEDPDLIAGASPITHVSGASPPCLLVHGDRDEALPALHSERFHQALTAAGGESACQIVPGAGHCFTGYDDVPGLVASSVAYLAAKLR
jgi:acetyl esterase/lipase